MGRTLLYGPPKVGKTMLLLTLADALDQGVAFLGWPPTPPMGVLYVSVDATNADMAQQAGGPHPLPYPPGMQLTSDFPILSHNLLESDPRWVPQYFLDTSAGVARLTAQVRALDPDVVLFDGLTYATAVADVNSGSHVKLTYQALDRVTGGRPYVLLGHDNKEQQDDSRHPITRMKGAIEWVAGVSAYYHMTASDDGTRGQLDPGGRNIMGAPVMLARQVNGRWARRHVEPRRARVFD